VKVRFSPDMKQALSDLAAAVHFSDHFDPEMGEILENWGATGKGSNLHGFLGVLPHIAAETFRHIHATGDKRAEEAWSQISALMMENGYILERDRNHARER